MYVGGAPASGSPGLGTPSFRRTRVRRRGILGWWLDLTAPPQWSDSATAPLVERERIRKAELTSYSILLVFGFLVAFVSNSLADPGTAAAIVLMAITLFFAAALNRTRASRFAAYMAPSALMLVTMLAVVAAPGGLRLIVLPALDIFAIPIFLTSLTCNRKAPWIYAFIAIAFIVADMLLQPHALVTATGLATPGQTGFDEIAREAKIFSTWGLMNRHVALCFFAAFFGWLGAQSVDRAIRRADRAEEIAAMEHAIVEQKQQLDYGIKLILDTHVRAANGDFNARAPLNQENVLWQIAASLNNLLARLQRAGSAEHQLRRTDEEVRRLAAAIRDAQQGRPPIWPVPTGTSVDLLLDVIGRGAQAGRDPRQAPPLQAPTSTPMAGYGQPTGPSQPTQSASNPYLQRGPASFASGQMPQAGNPYQPQSPHNNPWTTPDEEPR
jgi:hypothetical protein